MKLTGFTGRSSKSKWLHPLGFAVGAIAFLGIAFVGANGPKSPGFFKSSLGWAPVQHKTESPSMTTGDIDASRSTKVDPSRALQSMLGTYVLTSTNNEQACGSAQDIGQSMEVTMYGEGGSRVLDVNNHKLIFTDINAGSVIQKPESEDADKCGFQRTTEAKNGELVSDEHMICDGVTITNAHAVLTLASGHLIYQYQIESSNPKLAPSFTAHCEWTQQ